MKKCEKCNSENVKQEAKNLNEKLLDNVIHILKCLDCGHEKIEIKHIG